MALEARVPLLDHKLCEFAATIPPEMKMQGNSTKHIFKKALRGILPDNVLDKTDHLVHITAGSGSVPNWSMLKWAVRHLPTLRRELWAGLSILVASLGVDPDRLLATEQPSPGEARKLLIALWRLVTTGETPDGVVLRPAA